jgi:hypothetical protein
MKWQRKGWMGLQLKLITTIETKSSMMMMGSSNLGMEMEKESKLATRKNLPRNPVITAEQTDPLTVHTSQLG